MDGSHQMAVRILHPQCFMMIGEIKRRQELAKIPQRARLLLDAIRFILRLNSLQNAEQKIRIIAKYLPPCNQDIGRQMHTMRKDTPRTCSNRW